jgi:flavin-dependent dehydrogenase
VQTGVSVTGTLTDATGRVTGVALRDRDGRARELRARLVVGADGVRSRIARSVGAQVLEQGPRHGSTSYTYVARPDWEGFEFHIGERSFAGVFTTHHGEANVWLCEPGDPARRDQRDFLEALRRAAPSLAERVDAGRITAPVRSATGLPNHVLEAAGPGWALVGDAGYHRDPITGHGITDAFRDAELLARRAGEALAGAEPEDHALRAYATERRTLLAPIFEVTCQLAQFPPLAEFIELQKQLSALIDAEAAWLADLPPVPHARRFVAA